MEQQIIADYNQRIAAAQEQVNKYKKLVDTYSFTRLGAFLLLLVLAVVSAVWVDYIMLSVSVFAFILVFGWLVSKQNGYDAQLLFFKNLKIVNENEVSSITSRLNIYANGDQYSDDKHYYTADLDIFGPSSLFQLVNRCATTPGNNMLAGWFNAPSKKEVILSRQKAVEELAAKKDWKLNLQASLLFATKHDKEQLKRLFAYLNLPIVIPHEKLLVNYIKVAPIVILLSCVASFFYHDAIYLAVVIGLVNARITTANNSLVDKADILAGRIGKELSNYAEAFKVIENESFTSAHNQAVADKITNQQNGAVSANIKALSRLINDLNIRLNFILAAVFNVFLLWNVRQLIAIENWKRNNHASIEGAFDGLAEFEAILSVAGLHINYPEWCFPQIADGEAYTLSAKGIAHPLISSKTRVENDYELEDSLNIDIITGSNMAGKSTFLRTLGINTVLALSGAPVCAQRMEVSVITIISYMRIKDSLNESTSTFKAELDRLQMLLAAVEGPEKIFFLIDEMLRGTNSVDKYKGSKAVIEQLIHKKGVGLVATHDLQIALLEQKYPRYIRNFYFDIQVINGEMIFDYKMKHGECKTFNASLLLKQIGIDVDAED
ncbi:MutS-like protein [Mucilaginibacter gracilis]|uniref:MutS-like protein n=1 Tax=Mucilaginibacter gracilis TaxID=423350 RepID=A0A495IUT3_9SPHI|nr:DNA mismatch repair protein MutS [Mucilaginibacter gracilis]RKR80223.1 MutS-like protein [Mucilaginibacter gracilis]